MPDPRQLAKAGGLSPSQIQTAMKTWLAYVEQRTGRKPMIYTGAFMSANVGTGFSSYAGAAEAGPTTPPPSSDAGAPNPCGP